MRFQPLFSPWFVIIRVCRLLSSYNVRSVCQKYQGEGSYLLQHLSFSARHCIVFFFRGDNIHSLSPVCVPVPIARCLACAKEVEVAMVH